MLLSISSSKPWKIAALCTAATILCQAAEAPKSVNPTPFTNRLAKEKSPYLLQHQHNPVDWYAWGDEAFARAKKENKPIFLSIGYSTCHWCHVMAHESFENAEVAKLLNDHFVSIKLDREERPDVDRVYMTFVQATTGSGGWPMSVFLTPDLKPFLGGTYFPPEDRFGRPGFKTLLQRIADGWRDDREGIVKHGNTVIEQLREYADPGKPGETKLSEATLTDALAPFIRTYDEEWGGFADAPKFPRPSTLNLLFRAHARFSRSKDEAAQRNSKAALGMALGTLRKMSEGGMHDHLGGGFHRYSVDRFWHVPHYEKMLYDQAQLVCSYLDAWQAAPDPLWEKTARDILGYVQRDLTAPEGGFFSAEDADSIIEHGKPEHAEGAFYVWTKDEIDQALGEEAAAVFRRVYGVEEDGNSPAGSDPHGELKGKNTLIVRMKSADATKFFKKTEAEIEQSLADSRRKLFDIRAKRPRPHLDDKIITAWNGLMISAFARAAQIFEDPTYLKSAQAAAGFIRKEMWKDGALRRSYRQGAGAVPGFAEDYAFLAAGLLDLYEADFDVQWLQWSVELQAKMDATFFDEAAGGYFSTSGDDPSVLLRMKEDYDGAEPSPSSVAAMNLLRLSQLTSDAKQHERSDRTLASFSERMTKLPSGVPQMLCALDYTLSKPRQVVIAGARDAADTRALLREVHSHFIPNKLLLLADGGPGQDWLGQKLEFIRTVTPIGGKAAAYVCEDFVCQLPTSDVIKLRRLLEKGSERDP
jgi:uncharacterized protein YyaL (SSP411 family)